jgi:hypothetical protein
MSTTFGILRIGVDHDKIVDDQGEVLDYISDNAFEPIWFRSNTGRWLNNVGPFLDDDIKVYALDNSRQGVFTIGDIKVYMEKQENKKL